MLACAPLPARLSGLERGIVGDPALGKAVGVDFHNRQVAAPDRLSVIEQRSRGHPAAQL